MKIQMVANNWLEVEQGKWGRESGCAEQPAWRWLCVSKVVRTWHLLVGRHRNPNALFVNWFVHCLHLLQTANTLLNRK